jgi:hypothetical protein
MPDHLISPTFDPYKCQTAGGQATRQIINAPPTPLPVTPPIRAVQPPHIPAPPTNPSTDPSCCLFKPQVFRRNSTNYEEADAAARAARAESERRSFELRPEVVEEGGKEKEGAGGEEGEGGCAGKPQYGRRQSWDRQEWKHRLQMSEVVEKQKEDVLGFSEKGGCQVRFSQS